MRATVGSNLRAQTPFPLLARKECVVVFVELDLAVPAESEGPRLSATVSPHLRLEKCSECTELDHREASVTAAEMGRSDTTPGAISRQRAKHIFEYPHQ